MFEALHGVDFKKKTNNRACMLCVLKCKGTKTVFFGKGDPMKKL